MTENEAWPDGWNPRVPASARARYESGDQATRVIVKAEHIGMDLVALEQRDSEGNQLYNLTSIQFGPATLGQCEEWLAHET